MEDIMKEKKKSRFSIRKIIISVVFLTIMLTIPGCGEVIQAFMTSSLATEIENRVNSNIEILESLGNAGLLSDTMVQETKSDMLEIAANIRKLAEAEDQSALIMLNQSVVSYKQYTDETTTGIKYYDENGKSHDVNPGNDENGNHIKGLDVVSSGTTVGLDAYLAGNYMASVHGVIYRGDGTVSTDHWREDMDAEPVRLLSDDMKNELNKKFAFNVYVLNPTATQTGQSSSADGGIDGLIELFQQSIQVTQSEGGTSIVNVIDPSFLNNYFSPAIDSEGNQITLLDTSLEENQIIKASKANKDSSLNVPGKDLVITQNGHPQFEMRFIEFDKEVYDKINSLLGMNNTKYVFSSADGQNNVYLMEYPVYYIDSLTDNKDNTVTANLERSGIGLNLLTGKIIKYDSEGDGWLNSGTYLSDTVDSYLTVSGAENNDDESKSSFIIKGVCQIPVGLNLDESTSTDAYSGRIILRDYLEATYSPGVSTDNNSSLAVYGRKIRINFSTDDSGWIESDSGIVTSNSVTKDIFKQYTPVFRKGVSMANFVDKNGNDLTGESLATDLQMPELQITDFADFDLLAGADSEPQVKTLNLKNMSGVSVTESDSDSIPGENAKINELTRKTGDSVNISGMFPGQEIGTADYNSDTADKQRFYCLSLDSDMFDTSLFSAWINSSDPEASLEYWNNYLAENNMMYSIDHNAVNDYLMSNYQYELSQNGMVILDLETVAKIQKEMNQENVYSRNRFVSTSIVVIGWILIGYAMLLMLAWVLDTNADMGIKLTEKLTLGHWVAIRYKDDMPYYDASERKYMTLGNMIMRCSVVIVVGILLLRIDVFEIVLFLINMFGDAAIKIEEIIRGI